MKISKLLTLAVGLSLSQQAFALRLASPTTMANIQYSACIRAAGWSPMKKAMCAAKKAAALKSVASTVQAPAAAPTSTFSSAAGTAVTSAYNACLASAGSNIFKKIACKAKQAASLNSIAASSNGIATTAGQSVGACKFGDEKCLRIQRDIAFRACLGKYGPFSIKKCQAERDLAIKSSISQQNHLQMNALKAQRLQQLGYQGKVTLNSAQAQSGLPTMERMANRSFGSAGPNLISGRSMVSRAVDRSRDVARTASYRSFGRTRGQKVMASQGRAFDPNTGYSAQHRQVMARRAAMEQSQQFSAPRTVAPRVVGSRAIAEREMPSAYRGMVSAVDGPSRSIASVSESAPAVMQRFPTSSRSSATFSRAPMNQRLTAEPMPVNTFYGR